MSDVPNKEVPSSEEEVPLSEEGRLIGRVILSLISLVFALACIYASTYLVMHGHPWMALLTLTTVPAIHFMPKLEEEKKS